MSVEVIGFRAEWCGPCKQLRPILDELDEEYEDVEFSHVDIAEETETVNEYSVQSVPTLVILNDGEIQTQMTGFQQKETIEEQLTALV
ncbi:thioredoxin family protein [Natrialba asiatica]|uniref:Thioredoxin n=1 Tax=Natrialba asiatica (strain ATCC 700177 / DSM 12278 / JCM 9576 / FERM P-10747 / NBRC 102637 / 172P1) TaxID=29540 RepID=M0AHC0_NATA1|nr:thioredoxin domain-containing protein [Natrialba asiatica]ELY97949.1 thioredoxin [Natrialba asiatica DSM 12278]